MEYVLIFHPEVRRQTDTTNFKNEFPTIKRAYEYAIGRWGSAITDSYVKIIGMKIRQANKFTKEYKTADGELTIDLIEPVNKRDIGMPAAYQVAAYSKYGYAYDTPANYARRSDALAKVYQCITFHEEEIDEKIVPFL
jgi:hypothetical protein